MDRRVALLIALAFALSSCERMVTPHGKQILRDAETKYNDGDFAGAITLYEQALDTPENAPDIHYKLALLYDDKLGEPLNAIHHFRRYLAIAPNGPRVLDVKSFIKRDELALLTSLSGDSVVPRAEAVRLRNENLALRKQLEDERAKNKAATGEASPAHAKKTPAKKRSGSH